MGYYLKQRQYAKKVYVCAFRLNLRLWSKLPRFVDWQLLRRPTLLLFLAHRRVLTTVILLPDPEWKQAGWFSLGHAQGSSMRAPSAGQMVIPACWGTISLSWNEILWASTRLTQPMTFMTIWQLIEEHTEKQGTEMVKISSPSGVDWLRKTEVRNISRQVTVGHRDTRVSVLLKMMS